MLPTEDPRITTAKLTPKNGAMKKRSKGERKGGGGKKNREVEISFLANVSAPSLKLGATKKG